MEKITLIGHIGQDATETKNGGHRFTVASTYKQKSGEARTNWYTIFVGDHLKSVVPYLKKGTQVYIEGLPAYQVYEGKPQVSINAAVIQLLGGKSGGDHKEDDDDPIPF